MSVASELLRENRPLFALVYRFNCQSALDLHPGHLNGLADAGLVESLTQSPRGEMRLSEHFARRFELDPAGHWEFAEPALRLATLDRHRFEQLVTLTGAAVLHRSIGHIIQRQPLRQLKQEIGDEVYTFALKRAPFLVGKQADASAPRAPSGEFRSWVDAAGLERLSACWQGCPRAVHERLRLKLPPGAELTPVDQASPANRDAAFRLAQKILLQEVAPSLKPCFN